MKTITNLSTAVLLSIALISPITAQADIMATLAMKAAQSYAEKAIQDTAMQEKVLNMIQNDPGLKDRVMVGIKNVIANPKYAAHREKAITFLSEVEQTK